MGLSDGERYGSIVHIVRDLSRMDRFKDYDKEEINPLLERLWPDFLRRSSNGMHWLMGSESMARFLDECCLLRVSFEQVRQEADNRSARSKKEPLDNWRKEYAPVDAVRLLDGEQRGVMEIVRYIESYFYAANRYEDSFAMRLAPLTETICKLRGVVHNIVSNDPVYCVAWMMQTILDSCFVWDDNDLVTNAGNAMNWQHDLRASRQDFAMVEKMFKMFQFKHDMLAHPRLVAVLNLMGERFHYRHQHKVLLTMIRAHNARATLALDLHRQGLDDNQIGEELDMPSAVAEKLRKDFIDESAIAALCEETTKNHDTREQGERQRYRTYCHFTQQES